MSAFTYAFKGNFSITKVIYFAIASAVTAFLVKKVLNMSSKSWGFDESDDSTVERAVSIVREGDPYEETKVVDGVYSDKALLSNYSGKVGAHNEDEVKYADKNF